MSFLIAAFVIAISCTIISYKTLFGYSKLKKRYKISLFVTLLISWFMPFIAIFIKYDSPSYATEYILNYFGYTLFVFVVILFILHFVRDFIWFFLYGIKKVFKISYKLPSPQDNNSLKIANIYTSILTIFVVLFGLYSGTKIADIKTINISSEKISEPTKLVLVSDLHIKNTDTKEEIKKIVDKVNGEKADFVILAGDTIDGKIDKIKDRLDILKNLESEFGTYVVLGNHEAYIGMLDSMKYFNKGWSYNLLFNQGKSFGDKNIFIGGINDKALDIQFYPNIERSLIGSENEYKILISHRPDVFKEAAEMGYDLMLSGHTHGGQIYPFHYFVKQAIGYVAGMYKEVNSRLYVSRGTRYWGPAIRLFSPSEITIINLIPNK